MKGFPYYCVAISSTLSSSRSHDRDLPALLNVNANSHKKTSVRMKEAKYEGCSILCHAQVPGPYLNAENL
jgi:hypothetical protein